MLTWVLSLFSGGTSKPIVIAICAIGLALALTVVAWLSYNSGYEKAEALGNAALATLQRQYSDASANATAEAYQKLERETKRADGVARELIAARNRIELLRQEITGGIPHAVAHTAPCSFGPEFVGLLNRAYGLGSVPVPKNSSPAGIANKSGEAASTGGGIREDASLEDLLTWGRDMGAYCQELEAQRDGLKLLLAGGE